MIYALTGLGTWDDVKRKRTRVCSCERAIITTVDFTDFGLFLSLLEAEWGSCIL